MSLIWTSLYMQHSNIYQISLTEVTLLQALAIKTYRETFAETNSEALLQQYFKEALSIDALSEQLNNQDSEFYFIDSVADSDNQRQLAGFLKLNINDAQTDLQDPIALEVEKIYISKDFLGQGLGKSLISFAIEQANKHQKEYLWLGVWEHNFSAIAFYQKMGFEKFGEHPFDMGGDIQTDLLYKKVI